MKYLGLCAIVKDEDPFLEEWICWHAMLGVEAFILYDNGSAYPVRRLLRPYMRGSFLTVVETRGTRQQIIAYNHCLRNFGKNFRWLGFLDLDEFAVPKQMNDLRVLLHDYEDEAALGLNWVCFGTGGHTARPVGTQVANYVMALQSEYWSGHIKSFVRPDAVSGIWNPHFAVPLKGGRTVNEQRRTVIGAFSPFSAEHAQINHYYYRSRQDYYEKLLRGRADAGTHSMPRKIAPPDGDTRDTSALRFAPALRTALEREDRAALSAARAAYFCRERETDALLAEVRALIARDKREEALVLLGHAAQREGPDRKFCDLARRSLRETLMRAA